MTYSLPFGKYRGHAITAVSIGYLRWLLGQIESGAFTPREEQVAIELQKELERREHEDAR